MLNIPEPQFSYWQNGDTSVFSPWSWFSFPDCSFAFYISYFCPYPHPSCRSFTCLHSWLCLFWFFFKVPSELSLVHVLRITNDYSSLVLKCVPDGPCSHGSISSGPAFQHVGSYCHPNDGVWTRKVEVFQYKRENERGYSNPDGIAHQHPQMKVNIVLAMDKNAKNAL